MYLYAVTEACIQSMNGVMLNAERSQKVSCAGRRAVVDISSPNTNHEFFFWLFSGSTIQLYGHTATPQISNVYFKNNYEKFLIGDWGYMF